MAKVVRSQGKVVDSVVGKDEEELKKYLIQEMQAKNNAKAVLSFLTEEQKTKIINYKYCSFQKMLKITRQNLEKTLIIKKMF